MSKITIELPATLRADLDFLKQIITNDKDELVKTDSELIENLIAWFVSMVEEAEEAHDHEHDEDWNCLHTH